MLQSTKSHDNPPKLGAFMKVNEKIRLAREAQHLSQEEMADKLHMSVSGYAKIERGETRSNLPRLEQISQVLDLDIFELLAYGEESSVLLNHSANNLSYSCISFGKVEADVEIQRLQLMLSHKDEIITKLNDEIAALKEIINLLKK